MIVKYYALYGRKWAKIAEHFNDRTDIMIKNRYYSLVKKSDFYHSLCSELDFLKDKDLDEINEEEYEKLQAEYISQRQDQEHKNPSPP
mmetsp:Transcript_20735/g.18152  ORF Transcript_20735/g.18152 Transcript_20735/m.18152 type:complete len:88 (+) Transcript_20735:711-974(+)